MNFVNCEKVSVNKDEEEKVKRSGSRVQLTLHVQAVQVPCMKV
jgi:hypothetical protein